MSPTEPNPQRPDTLLAGLRQKAAQATDAAGRLPEWAEATLHAQLMINSLAHAMASVVGPDRMAHAIRKQAGLLKQMTASADHLVLDALQDTAVDQTTRELELLAQRMEGGYS